MADIVMVHAYAWGKRGDIAMGNVGRIAENKIERFSGGHGFEETALNELDSVEDAVSFRVSPGQRKCLGRNVNGRHPRSWMLVSEGDRDIPRTGADIDGARIVWAGDLGPGENDALRRYYPDRTVWLLEPDARPPQLSRYEAEKVVVEQSPAPVTKKEERKKRPVLQFEEIPKAR